VPPELDDDVLLDDEVLEELLEVDVLEELLDELLVDPPPQAFGYCAEGSEPPGGETQSYQPLLGSQPQTVPPVQGWSATVMVLVQ
jgi:hypothetical protein